MKFLKSKKWLLAGGGALVVIILLTLGGSEAPQYDSATAKRGDIVEEVSVTGRVEPSARVDLAFERGGKVSSVRKDVGDTVRRGEVLVQLENGDILAQLAQAEANVKAEEARLEKILAGSRDEEINISKVKVQNAETAIREIKTSIEVAVASAYTTADDAVRNDADQLLSNAETLSPTLNLNTTNIQLKTNIEQGRVGVGTALSGWVTAIGEGEHKAVLADSLGRLAVVKNFLESVATAVNGLTANSGISQTTIDGYKVDIAAARTSINSSISTLTSAQESLVNAEALLELANKELALAQAPATIEDVKAQEAAIESARAAMQNFQAQLGKTIMRSPIDGVVTAQNVSVGEIVSAGVVTTSVITSAAFKIETDIPEADIADLSIGDTARVTLDAYGDDTVFNAVVTVIEPAEKIIDGVATYTTTLEFEEEDSRVKSGMTANIDILTDFREDVILIPSRAVLTRDNQKVVRVLDGDTYNEVSVGAGLRGNDGNIEITFGIEEGDEVVVFILE